MLPPARGMTISVTGAGGGFSAARSFSFKVDPARVKAAEAQIERARQSMADYQKLAQTELARRQGRVKALEAAVAKLPADAKGDAALRAALLRVDLINARADLTVYRDVEMQEQLLFRRREIAYAEGNRKAGVDIAKEHLALIPRAAPIRRKAKQEAQAEFERIRDAAASSVNAKAEVERILKLYTQDGNKEPSVPLPYSDVASAARHAGDGATYVAASLADLEQRHVLKFTERIHEQYFQVAENIARLTGDRGAAAAMYLRGRQVWLEQAKPAERERLRKSWATTVGMPRWWPRGTDAGKEIETDPKELDQRVRKLLPPPEKPARNPAA